jgi:hypothetical protein
MPTAGLSLDEAPPAASLSRFAANENYALVAAGDLTALYAAVAAVNAGTVNVIYLNADGLRTAPAVARTYWLTERLRFDRNVTVYGNGAILRQTPVTSAPNFPRVLYVPPGVTVAMRYVELTGANLLSYDVPFARYGGGVRNDGALQLVDSLVYDNTAAEGGGGILNTGVLWLRRTTIAQNEAGGGAGIQNDEGGSIVAACSRIIDNVGGYGVGILNGNQSNAMSSVTVNRGVFTGNVRTLEGTSEDLFNLMGDVLTLDASQNYWGADGVPNLPSGLVGSSILTTPRRMTDPTQPNASGGYADPDCAPEPDVAIPPYCVVAGPQCSPPFQPPTLSLTLAVDTTQLTAAQLADPTRFTIGERIPLIARVAALDGRDIAQPVRVELTVPRGLRPEGMTIQGESQSLLDALFSLLIPLLDAINPDLSSVLNAILGIGVTPETVTFTYDYDDGLIGGGAAFPITLEVVGRVAGTFTITGQAQVVLSGAGDGGGAGGGAGSPLVGNASLVLQVETDPSALTLDLVLLSGDPTQANAELVYCLTVGKGEQAEAADIEVDASLSLLVDGAVETIAPRSFATYVVAADTDSCAPSVPTTPTPTPTTDPPTPPETPITITDDATNARATVVIPILNDENPARSFRITATLIDYTYADDGLLMQRAAIIRVGEQTPTDADPFPSAFIRLPRGLEAAYFRGFEVTTGITSANRAFIPITHAPFDLSRLDDSGVMPVGFDSRRASYRLAGWIAVPDGGEVRLNLINDTSALAGLRIWVSGQLVYSRWAGAASLIAALPHAPSLQPLYAEYYFYVAPESDIGQPFTAPSLTWTGTDADFALAPRPVPDDVAVTAPTGVPRAGANEASAPGAMAYYATCPSGKIQLVPIFPGQGQETFDMRAVAAPTGARIHDGPTWNALQFGSHAWGSIVQIERRMRFEQTGDIADQVWYRQAGDLWIAGRMAGTLRLSESSAIEPFVYAVGLGRQDGDTDAFCNGVSWIGATETISFTYDRQAAAAYGIAHAYRNSTFESSLIYPDNQSRVTSRINNNNPPISVANGSVANPFVNAFLRYAYFIYPQQVSGDPGETGSAMFTSESIWMGGLPMTFDYQLTDRECPSVGDLESGWRYCSQDEIASFSWRAHTALTTYYSSENNPIVSSERGIISLNVFGITTEELVVRNQIAGRLTEEGFPLLTQEQNRCQFYDEYFNPSSTSDRLFSGIQQVQQGDYLFINRDAITGHGFLVVGWGQITSCPDALSKLWTFTTSTSAMEGQLFPNFPSAGSNLIVPYIVDFSGGISYSQLQRPRPRPFYCAQYNDGEDGNFFNLLDSFAFYGMPIDIVIFDNNQIYVPITWRWDE